MRRPFLLQESAKVHGSVVGLRSWIDQGAIIEDTLLMGADYYEVSAPLTVFLLLGGKLGTPCSDWIAICAVLDLDLLLSIPNCCQICSRTG